MAATYLWQGRETSKTGQYTPSLEYADMNSHDNDVIDAPAITRDYSSGRAAVDSRGNSVWEWQTAPGVYSCNADTQRVRALQVADLELLEAKAPGSEHAFGACAAKDYPSRVGINLPSRGKNLPEQKPQRNGLIKRLIGR
jgi:hypothetical protein